MIIKLKLEVEKIHKKVHKLKPLSTFGEDKSRLSLDDR